ncbi:uncharacterized protein LOC142978709 isoform X2 [Anticarsia gemmatalis]|uniref:uncharacterized protein LOC142978709 isoform X2 n=1 Tax=Anticarsia gemmatalis TaxID=129554 RepID=UPI003F77330A
MKFTGFIILVFLKILQVDSRMMPFKFQTKDDAIQGKSELNIDIPSEDNLEDHEKVIGLKAYDERDEEDEADFDKRQHKKPCAIVVLSSAQNPNMQSLLRRYRYDANGVLIPSSVKYFVKLPQGLRNSPLLVPLNDKAFSPLGGFVRYYKEVPPIPHAW